MVADLPMMFDWSKTLWLPRPFWLKWSHCHVQNTGLKCPGLSYAYLLEIAIGSSSTVLIGEIVTHHTRQHFFQSSAVQLWSPWVNYGLGFLFLAFRKGSHCGLSCCIRGWQRWVQRFCRPNWTEWLLEFLLPLFVTILLGSSPREQPLTEYFLFLRPSSVNPRHGCVWKCQLVRGLLKYSTTTIVLCLNSFWSSVFPHYAWFELQ